jgi:serine/threonine-protein kinase
MAPEQIAKGEAGPASDRYALAILAFETLTRRLPFEATGLGELLVRITIEEVPSVRAFRPGLPFAVDAVLARALAKDPRARHPTARAFVEALRAAIL